MVGWRGEMNGTIHRFGMENVEYVYAVVHTMTAFALGVLSHLTSPVCVFIVRVVQSV